MTSPLQHIEALARESYGRLLAYLASSAHDMSEAEDALSEALHAALTRWPTEGLPDKPEAWLLAVARRRLVDASRRSNVRQAAQTTLQTMVKLADNPDPSGIPDERLKLLFICAHPAIDAGIRTPLMLQTVLGLDATRIASAFLVAPTTMGQRLVRAKTKIRAARIPFVEPEPTELPERLDAVLQAIYAAYGTGWDDAFAADASRHGLATEALWLAELLVKLLPEASEAWSLLSLMQHCEARRDTRRNAAGDYVPLSEQDPTDWDHELINQAETHLRQAARTGHPGRFYLEAMIQSAHAERRFGRPTNWTSILRAYDALLQLAPTLGAHIARAAALASADSPTAALHALDQLPTDRIAQHQPYWALRTHLLTQLNRPIEAQAARAKALGLTTDPALRRFLQKQEK